jgi:hypothetical protein
MGGKMRRIAVVLSAGLMLAAATATVKDRVRPVDSQAMVFAHMGIYHANTRASLPRRTWTPRSSSAAAG